jgi:uncharacterized membrane protein YeiH
MLIFLIINTVGVLAFAVSGALKGIKHHLDIFGIVVLAVITSVGGGITRDVVLNVSVDALENNKDIYMAIALGILVYAVGYKRLENFTYISSFVKIADALGLALFTVIGAEKGLSNGLGILGTAVMATLTGVGGGVIRDILVMEIPFILKEEIYAVLCLSGGLIYWFGIEVIGVSKNYLSYFIIIFIFIIRLLAIKYRLNLPKGEKT